MISHRLEAYTIAPFAQESWADQRGDTYIEDIDILGIGGAMVHVGQRQIRDFGPEDVPVNVGSDGFSKCSGLIIRERNTGAFTFSHLEPFADEWHDLMRTGQRDPARWY